MERGGGGEKSTNNGCVRIDAKLITKTEQTPPRTGTMVFGKVSQRHSIRTRTLGCDTLLRGFRCGFCLGPFCLESRTLFLEK